MELIEQVDFLKLSYQQGKRLKFGAYQSAFLFECEDSRFNLIGYNGKDSDDEHFWIRFERDDVAVFANEEALRCEWTLDEEHEGRALLNIDAAPEIVHDRLVYPAGQGKDDHDTYLMNPATGSVDTKENWLAEMPDWEVNHEGKTAEQQFESLVEVVKDENGDWL